MTRKWRAVSWIMALLVVAALSTGMVASAGAGDPSTAPSSKEDKQTETCGEAKGSTASNPSSDQVISWRQLADQGWSPEEAQAAISLQAQTGISALTLLEDRKAGKSWPEIAEVHAKGMKLERHNKPIYDTLSIDEASIRALVAQGHARMDVLEAVSLAQVYSTTPEKVFALKSPDVSWPQVESNLSAMAPPKTTPDHLPPDLFDETGRTRTRSRLTEAEVWDLMGQGHTLGDIQMGEQMGEESGLTLLDLLGRRKSGQTWSQIGDELGRDRGRCKHQLEWGGATDQEVAARLRPLKAELKDLHDKGWFNADLMIAAQMAEEFELTLEQVLADYVKQGRAWDKVDYGPTLRDTILTLGITEERVKGYHAKGYTNSDLLMANTYSGLRGSSLEAELAEFDRQGRDWTKIGIRHPSTGRDHLTRTDEHGNVVTADRTASGLTLEEVTQLLETTSWAEIELADLWATRLKVDPRPLLLARSAGQSWEQIVEEVENGPRGSRLPEVLAALGADSSLADEVILTRAEVSGMEAMGFTISDMHRAGLIARATGKLVLEVAQLKTADNTWVDVAVNAPPDTPLSRHAHHGRQADRTGTLLRLSPR